MTNILQLALTVLVGIESGGNPNAYCASENAVGVLQERPIYVAEANRIAGTDYVHTDAWQPDRAREIARIVLTYWGNVYRRETGREPTIEVYVRTHNGVAYGWRNPDTMRHWERAKKWIERRSR